MENLEGSKQARGESASFSLQLSQKSLPQDIVGTKTLHGLKKQLENHQALDLTQQVLDSSKLLELERRFGEVQNVLSQFFLSSYSHLIHLCLKLLGWVELSVNPISVYIDLGLFLPLNPRSSSCCNLPKLFLVIK